MEIRYTHDHLDAEILARAPPNLAARGVMALCAGPMQLQPEPPLPPELLSLKAAATAGVKSAL